MSNRLGLEAARANLLLQVIEARYQHRMSLNRRYCLKTSDPLVKRLIREGKVKLGREHCGFNNSYYRCTYIQSENVRDKREVRCPDCNRMVLFEDHEYNCRLNDTTMNSLTATQRKNVDGSF